MIASSLVGLRPRSATYGIVVSETSQTVRDTPGTEVSASKTSPVPNAASTPDSESGLPDLIRTVSSFDAPELWAQCLSDQGFESSAPGGVVTTNDVVPEQQEIYWQTYADCVAQYPINAEYFQTWGEDQWRVQHEYLVEYFIPCVESYGIAINKDAIPEECAFVEAGLSNCDIWHPAFEWMADPDYQNLANTETPEGAEVATNCRQSPPENKLFG